MKSNYLLYGGVSLAAMAVVLLTGCGKGGDGASTGSSGTTSASTTTSEKPASSGGMSGGTKLSFERKYTKGDKLTYDVVMDFGANGVTSLTETQEVTDVHNDGSADLTMTMSNMKMKKDGKDMSVPATGMQPMKLHMDKYGSPVDDKTGSGNAMPFSAGQIAALKGGISQGQTIPYDSSTPSGMSSKGKLTFVDVEGGDAKLTVESDMTLKGKPNGHVSGTMFMEMGTAKLKKSDMTIKLPNGTDSHMTMQLKS